MMKLTLRCLTLLSLSCFSVSNAVAGEEALFPYSSPKKEKLSLTFPPVVNAVSATSQNSAISRLIAIPAEYLVAKAKSERKKGHKDEDVAGELRRWAHIIEKDANPSWILPLVLIILFSVLGFLTLLQLIWLRRPLARLTSSHVRCTTNTASIGPACWAEWWASKPSKRSEEAVGHSDHYVVPSDGTMYYESGAALTNAGASDGLSALYIPPVSLTGGKTRVLFVSSLCASDFARALSLALLLWFDTSSPYSASVLARGESSLRAGLSLPDASSSAKTSRLVGVAPGTTTSPFSSHSWFRCVVQSFPSLLFLSTYSIIILFFAQVYYAAILVSNTALRPTFFFINLTVYCLYAVIVGLTFLLEAASVQVYLTVLIGCLYLLTTFSFAYFGCKVASRLSDQGRNSSRNNNSIVNRVVILTTVCPTVFLMRALYSLMLAVKILPEDPVSLTPRLYDNWAYVVSDMIPSALLLFMFWSSKASQAFPQLLTHENSTPIIYDGYLGELHMSLHQSQRAYGLSQQNVYSSKDVRPGDPYYAL